MIVWLLIAWLIDWFTCLFYFNSFFVNFIVSISSCNFLWLQYNNRRMYCYYKLALQFTHRALLIDCPSTSASSSASMENSCGIGTARRTPVDSPNNLWLTASNTSDQLHLCQLQLNYNYIWFYQLQLQLQAIAVCQLQLQLQNYQLQLVNYNHNYTVDNIAITITSNWAQNLSITITITSVNCN